MTGIFQVRYMTWLREPVTNYLHILRWPVHGGAPTVAAHQQAEVTRASTGSARKRSCHQPSIKTTRDCVNAKSLMRQSLNDLCICHFSFVATRCQRLFFCVCFFLFHCWASQACGKQRGKDGANALGTGRAKSTRQFVRGTRPFPPVFCGADAMAGDALVTYLLIRPVNMISSRSHALTVMISIPFEIDIGGYDRYVLWSALSFDGHFVDHLRSSSFDYNIC